MIEPRDLLAGRWATVDARVRVWGAPGWRRSSALDWLVARGDPAPASTNRVRLVRTPAPEHDPPIARARRASYREDEAVEDPAAPAWSRGWFEGRWWLHRGAEVVVHDNEDTTVLLDGGPALSLFFAEDLGDYCSLRPAGAGTRAGRPVHIVRARPTDRQEGPPLALATGTEPNFWRHDEYRLEVDAERGALLAVTGFVDDVARQGLEVESIRFDVPLDPACFTFEAPPGARIERV